MLLPCPPSHEHAPYGLEGFYEEINGDFKPLDVDEVFLVVDPDKAFKFWRGRWPKLATWLASSRDPVTIDTDHARIKVMFIKEVL